MTAVPDAPVKPRADASSPSIERLAEPVLEARGVSKVFGGTVALDHVDLALRAGEIHALVGENGAGKSTLTKVLCGVHRPDTGELLLDGTPVCFRSPAEAQANSVAILYQEPALFGDLEVAENVFIGRQPTTGRPPRIDRRAMRRAAGALLQSLGVRVDPEVPVARLSLAEAQMVEMAGALSRKARVLIVDEPTAALTPREVEELFRVLRELRDRRVSVLFIGHRLEEVFSIADRITVLRDGQLVTSRHASVIGQDEVIRAMVGRAQQVAAERNARVYGEILLSARHLGRTGVFSDVSFEIRAGEVLGLAGLVGAGRSEVARAIFGVDGLDAGEVIIDGHRGVRDPADAVRKGLALVPESRQEQGLALELPIQQNISLPLLRELSRGGWVQRGRERSLAREWAQRLRVRARDVGQPARELSGGNQQKVVLAKWLATEPRVLILDEPTRGVDIGAKAEIHRLIDELCRRSLAILLISSDLPEILALSDRILVLREGRVAAQLTRDEATAERVIAAAAAESIDGRRPPQ